MAEILKKPKKQLKSEAVGHADKEVAAEQKKVVSRLMPRYENSWWDPKTKNWIGPMMHQDFLNDVNKLKEDERKLRMAELIKSKSWVCQLTPTSRSTCRRCGESIERKTFRIGYPIKDVRGDYYALSNWLHLKCASHAFYHEPQLCSHISKPTEKTEANSTPKIWPDLLEIEMINFSDVLETDKQIICNELQPKVEEATEDDDDIDPNEPLIKPRLVCKGLQNITMLKFQEEGLYWLKEREDDPDISGGILADEMGMGKTIQMISLIMEQKKSPTLVVCPTAAILQWRNEILKFSNDVDVRIFHGLGKNEILNDLPRLENAKNEKNSIDAKDDVFEEKIIIVLTTYQTMEYNYRQISNLKKVPCKYCGKYFLPKKLAVHLKYYCGPDAELTEKQTKIKRKTDAVKMMTVGGQETMIQLTTMTRKLAMAEGRKLADEMKKEQGVQAKKMKIGGVETEVTLKSNINQRRGFRESSNSSINGSSSNRIPYLPFPISALPKEAAAQMLPIQRGKKEKTTIKEQNSIEANSFDVDGYKKYNYAKLPEGGLAGLKKNFLVSFCDSKTILSVAKPSRKLSLKVNEITNTITSRKGSRSSTNSRKGSVGIEANGENAHPSTDLSKNKLRATSVEDMTEPMKYISVCGKKNIPPESEMDKVLDLSQPQLKFEHLSTVYFLLRKPKYTAMDKTKGKQLCKFLIEQSEFEQGMSKYRDSVEQAVSQKNGFLVSLVKKNKQNDITYTFEQCDLSLHYLKAKAKLMSPSELKKIETDFSNDPDVEEFLSPWLKKENANKTENAKITKSEKSKPSKSNQYGILNDTKVAKDGLSSKKADEILDLIPKEQRNHIVEDDESKLAVHRSPLLATLWHRVILDEAHRIKSRTTSTCQAALQLKAQKRWCVSGTPLQNRIGELFSLIRFTQYYPFSHYFCEKKGCGCCVLDWSFGLNFFCNKCNHAKSMHRNYFQKHVTLPLNKYGNNLGAGKKAMKLLQSEVLRKMVLRRTKVERQEDMHLPPLNITISMEDMTASESDFYESMYKQTKTQFDTYVDQGVLLNNYAHVFDLIMRLRQAVDHPYLIVHGLHNESDLTYGGRNELIPSKSRKTDPNMKMCHLCQEMIISKKELAMSNCGHGFHYDCIREYLQDAPEMPSGGIGCPTCFKSLSINLKDLGSQDDEDSNSTSSEDDDDEYDNQWSQRCSTNSSTLTRGTMAKNKFMDLIDVDKFESSTKIEALLNEIKDIDKKFPNEKILVFSQFIRMLDLIEFRLKQEYVACIKLTGSLTIQQRNNIITDFTLNDDGTKVLLISTKAGGEGLNLQRANHVFIMDPWWNPAVEFQAIQRAHRIGQNRPVIAKRFIVKDTIEEKIIELQNKKQAVFEATVGKDSSSWGKLSAEDLKFLFT